MELKLITILFAVCLLVRFSLSFFISRLNGKWLQLSSILGFFIALGFIKMIIVNRTQGAFNQKVWWGNYRLIHAALYFTFAIMALNKHQLSYLPILIDTFLGMIFFIKHRYIS